MDAQKRSDARVDNKIGHSIAKIIGRGQDWIFPIREEMHTLLPGFHQRLF